MRLPSSVEQHSMRSNAHNILLELEQFSELFIASSSRVRMPLRAVSGPGPLPGLHRPPRKTPWVCPLVECKNPPQSGPPWLLLSLGTVVCPLPGLVAAPRCGPASYRVSLCARLVCVCVCVCMYLGYYRFYQVFPVGPVWPHWRPRVGLLPIIAGLRCRPGVHPCIALRPVRYALWPDPGMVALWLPPGQLHGNSPTSPSSPCVYVFGGIKQIITGVQENATAVWHDVMEMKECVMEVGQTIPAAEQSVMKV